MRILFSLLLAFTFTATAQEHKKERKPKGYRVTAEQIEKAKDLPGTVVIRTKICNKNDKACAKEVAVLQLNDKLAKNQRVAADAAFEQIAVNGEVKELNFVPQKGGNQRDATSATPAVRYGWGGGGFRGGFIRGPNGGVIAGGRWGGAWGGGRWGGYGWGGGYWPSYTYGGYYYPYQPYYSYVDAGYSYSVCGCPTYYCGGYGSDYGYGGYGWGGYY
jgi:hypothetical protein